MKGLRLFGHPEGADGDVGDARNKADFVSQERLLWAQTSCHFLEESGSRGWLRRSGCAFLIAGLHS